MTPLAALQQTLAGEHAAVYVYGVLGGRVSASAHPSLATRLTSAYTTHRRRRDELTAMIRHRRATPVAAEVSYRIPNPARTGRQLSEAALVIERRCCEVYASTVENTSRGDRRWAIDALADASVRLLSFGGSAEPWPGAPEL